MSIPSTPNPLQTANVGVTIPTEAIDAAVERMFTRMEWASLHWLSIESDQMRHLATAALTAAAPHMEAALLRRIEVQAFIIAERDKELMQIQGPCRAPGCGLHRAHNGPCTIREGKTK